MSLLARARVLRIDGFVMAIAAAAIVASALPVSGTAARVLNVITTISVGLLFFLYGTRLSPREALAGLTHWRLHATVLACTYMLFPLIGLALVVLRPGVLGPDLYTGVLYLTLVPSTVQSSIAFTSLARGNVAGAVVSASVSNILGVFITPLLVIALLTTSGNSGIAPSAIVDVALQLLAPFVLGQILRPWVAPWLGRHSSSTKLVDRGSILLIVYAAFSESMTEGVWSTLPVWRILAVIAVCALVLAAVLTVTSLVGRWLRFDRGDRIVVLFCGSKKSLASGLPMATVLFAGQPIGTIVLPLLIFHQIQLIVCAVIAGRYERKLVQAQPTRRQGTQDRSS